MRHKLLVALLGAAALVAGCATKNYVRQTVQPVNAKIDQTNATVAKEQTEIDQTKKTWLRTRQKSTQWMRRPPPLTGVPAMP